MRVSHIRAGLLAAAAAAALSAAARAAEPRTAEANEPSVAASFDDRVAPFFAMYCTHCHGDEEPEADLALDRLEGFSYDERDREFWLTLLDVLDFKEMPPEEEVQPTEQERAYIVRWIDARLAESDCDGPRFPGRVTIRRLNRAEYNNTIRDLVGVDFSPADDFPSDDVGAGFDNIADVLSISPILTEKYLDAAEQIVERAFEREELRRRLVFVEPGGDVSADEAARRVLERFTMRAYRRPLRDGELERLMQLVRLIREEGADFNEQIRTAMQAVLVSPHFLFRIEQDPSSDQPGAVRELGGYEIATRLSYFLWSSMPDEELFDLAERGELSRPEVLAAQVRRMLDDPKSRALVDNFAAQWLNLRHVEAINPDPERFPEFDESLRAAMLEETRRYFEHILREDRSVLDFLDADYSFVNERLARHYGIEGVEGERFRRVELPEERGGVLTQGSILLLTSNPTRTSPVKRGKWILENILNDPPKEPPAGVEELAEGEDQELLGSLRERMEMHRAKPECATCHNRMDPLGFGFENFDAVGAWRRTDGRHAIDASGELPSGETFDGPKELRAMFRRTRQGQFTRALAVKMLTYALGREVKYFDRCAVDDIVERMRESDNRMSSLILGVVHSDPFLKRANTGDPP